MTFDYQISHLLIRSPRVSSLHVKLVSKLNYNVNMKNVKNDIFWPFGTVGIRLATFLQRLDVYKIRFFLLLILCLFQQWINRVELQRTEYIVPKVQRSRYVSHIGHEN